MEPESSLPYSQVPANCPYPEQARSSPHNPLPLPEDPYSYYPSIYAWVSQVVSFPHLILLHFITRTIFGEQCRSLIPSLRNFLYSSVTSSLLSPNIPPTPYSETPSAYVPPSMLATKFHTHTKQAAKLYFSIS